MTKPMSEQLLAVGFTLHKASILLFGYFIPALSSVKAVVRKDAEAYHQWSTYWLILHLYITILSPLLHLTLHPAFQLLAILWLSLPQYQGASLVYDRIVNPWVDRYERRVDDAVEEAHRGARRWVWSRLGGVAWMLIGEGGSFAEALMNVALGFLGADSSPARTEEDREVPDMKPSDSAESLPPRHSVREALRQSSSVGEVEEVVGDRSFDPTDEFVDDFLSILRQGLYVFANVDITDGATTEVLAERKRHVLEGGFKLGTFSYTEDDDGDGEFLISPATAGSPEFDADGSSDPPVRLPIDSLKPLRSNGSQGLILESNGAITIGNGEESYTKNAIRAEIVLSDESDRDIMLNGLNACLPFILNRDNNEF
mmetsp:Transcript_8185/g.20119  ORF Transcript_8185/g.20119 Transcript_8185/m.20119 type:complete len:370 (+) Transcript_8185:66-1175(+)|eukprot:CAMPEP_0181088366 /NCGR_PEP_ID=MMETSP1071-20121207/6747_1 /TAXON_ID=35127 /ORGANISM="Thalassiosira sp., Strain NH16" /LENGTH=369 /DNA_ID=CAMNT_0023170275 /DNA_START=44 /DNA_END=1153 /DNA_ORIENTATION=+